MKNNLSLCIFGFGYVEPVKKLRYIQSFVWWPSWIDKSSGGKEKRTWQLENNSDFEDILT